MAAFEQVNHPSLRIALGELRARDTPPGAFRAALERASLLLAVEALRDLPERPRVVETPLEPASATEPAARIVLVPILRAGLGMVDAALRVAPGALVAHVGIRRDERTLQPQQYYSRLPERLDDDFVLVLDPMLATGGTAVEALRQVRERGARNVRLVCVIAAPEGVAAVARAHPGVPILLAALDRGLDERGYIRPGLGDAGDRVCGTL